MNTTLLRRALLGDAVFEALCALIFILALLLFTTFNDLGSFGLWESVGRLIG